MADAAVPAASPPATRRPPIDLASYDRRPDLTPDERRALASLAVPGAGPRRLDALEVEHALCRLLLPVRDVLHHIAACAGIRTVVTRSLMLEVQWRGVAYWGWLATDWLDVVGATPEAYTDHLRLTERASSTHANRGILCAIAYLLGPDTLLTLTTPAGMARVPLARKVFTPAAIERECGTIMEVLAGQGGWGYNDSPHTTGKVRWAVAELLLLARSPHLDAVTPPILDAALAQAVREAEQQALRLASRVLVHRGILPQGLPPAPTHRPPDRDTAADTVPIAWRRWVAAWEARASQARRSDDARRLLMVGRWLAETHPHITTPDQWDEDLAAAFVAAVRSWTAGQYAGDPAARAQLARRGLLGKPLMPATINNVLVSLRAFFAQLQEMPHRVEGEEGAQVIPRRFNPARALATPRAIKALIGPDPRVIDDATWLKLVHATGQLTEEDLPRCRWTHYPLSCVKAVAAVWCYAARRSNEIARLRIGCIRWAWDETMRSEVGELLPQDAYCFLHVPANKTSTAFWVPVNGNVGRAIEAWERERPALQPALVDAKDNALVDRLFCCRGRPLRATYINDTLIPMLCKRAGVPERDSRGPITSHRARATIATALYNAEEGLTLDELRALLGHANLSSTQAYARVDPLRLAKRVKVASASLRRVPVLYDPAAEARGEPHLFFQLDEESYCGNPAWHACPHRLACQRCPMFVGPGVAKEIAARDGIIRMLADVPMTPEEKAAAEGDLASLEEMIALKQDRPTPAVPSDKYVFNPFAVARGTPLPMAAAALADRGVTESLAELGRRHAARTRQADELERTRGSRAAVVRALRREIARIAEDMDAQRRPTVMHKEIDGRSDTSSDEWG